MNTNTQAITRMSDKEASLNPEFLDLALLAKKDCYKCGGRGAKMNQSGRKWVRCQCTISKPGEVRYAWPKGMEPE